MHFLSASNWVHSIKKFPKPVAQAQIPVTD